MFVYLIINKLNDKKYVGLTKQTIKERFYEHICKSRRQKLNEKSLHFAMKICGTENFTIEVLKVCSSLNEMNKYERYYIKYYNTMENGYNFNSGGANFVYTEEYKNYLSETSFNSKEVYVFKADGSFVGKYYSVNKACRVLNIKTKPAFRVLSGLRKSTSGYHLSYDGTFSTPKEKRKKVFKYDLNGNFIQEYESITECARCNNTSNSSIWRVIYKRRKQNKGYIYSFEKL